MSVRDTLMRWTRILKLWMRKINRRMHHAHWWKTLPGVWKRTIRTCASAVGVIGLSLVCVGLSSHHCHRCNHRLHDLQKQDAMIQILKQQKAQFEQMKSNLGPAFITLCNKITADAVPLRAMLETLKRKSHLISVDHSIDHVEQSDGQSTIDMKLSVQSSRDKMILSFLHELQKTVPGIIVYRYIKIKRVEKVCSKKEFDALREEQKRKKKIRPAFKATIECQITIPESLQGMFLPSA